jgi:hypothetical protein
MKTGAFTEAAPVMSIAKYYKIPNSSTWLYPLDREIHMVLVSKPRHLKPSKIKIPSCSKFIALFYVEFEPHDFLNSANDRALKSFNPFKEN